jgi:hypothetical protein
MPPTTPFKRLILRAVLHNISPMVIRLVSVSDRTDLPGLHDVFHAILGWSGDLGYLVRVHGQEFNSFRRSTRAKAFRDFQLHRQETFLHVCDVMDLWEWAVRVLCDLLGLIAFDNLPDRNGMYPMIGTTDGGCSEFEVAVIKDEPQNPSLDLRALDNPYISGVALQIHWNDIEAVEGKADWSKLDALFNAAKSSNKWVQLFIFPGFFTPAWALEGVKTDPFAIQYGPGTGTVLGLPMPCNGVYLSRWFAFLKRLSDRYGTSPAFKVIAADGPTSVSDEATLPRSPQDLKRWQNDGFKPSKYLAAWRETLKVYAADFPNQYVSLSLGRAPDILAIDDEGKIHANKGSHTRQTIVNEANSRLGRRFALQMNDVHAGPDASGSNSQIADQYIIGYIGRVITAFQMGGGMEHAIGSRKMGAEGNPALALRRSIDLALTQNQTGQHVNYVEIYEADVLPANMQPVLRDESARFPH